MFNINKTNILQFIWFQTVQTHIYLIITQNIITFANTNLPFRIFSFVRLFNFVIYTSSNSRAPCAHRMKKKNFFSSWTTSLPQNHIYLCAGGAVLSRQPDKCFPNDRRHTIHTITHTHIHKKFQNILVLQ